MRRPRAPSYVGARAVVGALLALALGGCVGHPAAPMLAKAQPPIVVSTPPTEPDAAPDPAERQQGVVYDFWGGRASHVLVDENFTLGSDTPLEHLKAWNDLEGFGLWYSCAADTGACKLIHLPPGHTVYPGTDSILITGSWTGPPLATLTVAWVDPTGNRTYRPFEPGSNRIEIPVRPATTDPPTTGLSRWKFAFLSNESLPGAIEPLRVHASIEILRGSGPLPVSHGFADPWDGTSTRVVGNSSYSFLPWNCGPGICSSLPIVATSVIPWHTGIVDVRFRYTREVPTSTGWTPLLTWASADRNLFEYEGVEVAPSSGHAEPTSGSLEWRLAVKPRMWDSPLVDHTAWSFLFDLDGWPPAVQEGDGSYQVVITAEER